LYPIVAAIRVMNLIIDEATAEKTVRKLHRR